MKLRQTNRAVSYTRGKMYMYAVGGVAILISIAMLAVGYLAPRGIPGRSYYNVKAAFKDADNLTNSYQVRIGGRLVGQVLDPEVGDRGEGVVRLQLTSDVKPLKSDTRLRVRPRSAVGVRFVELIPGTKGTNLGENDVIPSSQTSESVQLDEALNTFDADRRQKASVFLDQLGVGTLSRGDDLNAATKSAPQFLADARAALRAVNAKQGAPTRLVKGGSDAANAADPVRETIASGWRPESRALDVFQDHEQGLRDLLDNAPTSLRGIRTGLVPTSPLLREVRGMAAELGPTLRESVPALRNTNALLKDGRPGLRELPATLSLVDRAVPPTVRVLRTVLPVLPATERFLTEPLPLLDGLAPRGCDIGLFNSTWSSGLSRQSANHGVLRLHLLVSQESLFGVTDEGAKLIPGSIRSNPYPAPCAAGRETQ